MFKHYIIVLYKKIHSLSLHQIDVHKLWRIFTKSCNSFWCLAITFLVPRANTKVSMSSSLRVTLICYKQTDTFRCTDRWLYTLHSSSYTPHRLIWNAIWLIHTTWSQAGLIILARTLSRSCLFTNWQTDNKEHYMTIFNTNTPLYSK